MVDWDSINCRICPGHCNAKGYPSISKGSKVCKEQRGMLSPERTKKWKDKLFDFKQLVMNKGLMRKAGSISNKGEDENEADK